MTIRRRVALSALLVLGTLGLTSPAHAGTTTDARTGSITATPSECDNYSFDVFGRVGWGVSFSAYGRNVDLRNGRAFNHSFAMISAATYRSGDQVWADRSLQAMPSSVPTHFRDDNIVISRGGWKQCGPFQQASQQVMNWNTDTQHHFAVRACMRPNDGRPSVCGEWYVDRS
ncbi:hypothetical protein [Streptosporangium sp. NPDC006007]|uniref:hypothetical protein n=1 Tax=Streptosporangium sp. NPDC006007 TaxID=3154575 RepID=UPI0033AF72EA